MGSIGELMNLKGRVALVTGGSRGIGRSIALALAEFGADVALSCEANVHAAESVATDIRAMGQRAQVIQASLGNADGPKRTFDRTIAALGRIDILILNASLQIPKPWQGITPEDFEQQVNVNFRASMELMQLVAPAMQDRKWGRIVTIGSVQEAKPHPDMLVYAATKSAQESMSRNLAKQLGPFGITVNNIAPGVILTDRSTSRLTSDEYRQKVLNNIPTRTFGQPEDCAGAVVLICSDAGRYINGANLFIDGGMQL
jgi:NAD(P)-dependent dehydrogenase (short-subunit alcohol dehydrogenase family)